MTKAAFFGFGWLRPAEALWALLALAVLALGWWAVRSRSRAIETLVARRQLPRFVSGWSKNRSRARFFFAAAALVFLAFASAGPVRGFSLREVKRRGLDLVVCIDTSRSMLVRDLRPDRITRARREVQGLLERLHGDRMALIAFAGDAREIAPLTHDPVALFGLLETMTPAENEKGGTDLGAALERALALFDGRTGAHECIVMLTDGEDLEGHGLEVARKAAERGVKVFVVGMGTEAGGKIPVERPGGGETFLRDAKNQEVVSSMSGKGLDELATTTGGAYLSADASAAPLEELYDKRISRLEARELQGGQEFVPHDRFQWFLGIGVACMLLAAGLGERRGRSRRRRAPKIARQTGSAIGAAKNARPAWARALAPLLLLPQIQTPPPAPSALPVPAPSTTAAPAPVAIVPYEHSVAKGLSELRSKLEANSLDEAKQIGERLIAKPGLAEAARSEVEYTRGVVLERRGELGDSAAAFARAGGIAPPGPLRLDAWYNTGAVALEAAEPLFLSIPEVRQARKLPQLAPPTPPAPGSANAAQPNPNEDLDNAQAAFQVAKLALIHRLRADWKDVDTRANLELIQRRLSEIEKIRKQREEQKQKEDKQKDDKQDPKDKKDKGDDKQDPDKKKDPDKKPDKDSKPDESKDQKSDEEKAKQDQPKPGEGEKKPEDKKQPPEQAKPGEARALSKEEISRLMDQLANIEQEAKQLQARIRARRRPPVEKDW